MRKTRRLLYEQFNDERAEIEYQCLQHLDLPQPTALMH
jgi:hypothetical protein